MIAITLAFLLGNLWWQSKIIQQYFVFLLLFVSILLCCIFYRNLQNRKILVLIAIFIFGYLWLQFRVDYIENKDLLRNEIEKILNVSGQIQEIPRQNMQFSSFNFKINYINQRATNILVHLNWSSAPSLIANSQCLLKVRLYRPRGLVNPGGFDFSKWAFAEHFRAVGNVLSGSCSSKISSYRISNFRQIILQKLERLLFSSEVKGFIEALTIGVQHQITAEQWQVLQATGTNHLMAIAGVHLGFVGLFFYGLTQIIWRIWPKLSLWVARKEACLVGAFIAATIYALLTGFALPAQRAVIMNLLLVVFTLRRRAIFSWHIFCLSVWVILLVNPLEILQMSFWLSFGAVAVILFGMNQHAKIKKWQHFLKLQWVLSLGLLPCSLIFFNQFSTVAFVANLLAVPLVGLGVLPLCMLGLISINFPTFASTLFLVAGQLMKLTYSILNFLAGLKFAIWYQTIPNQIYLLLTVFGVALFLAPSIIPLRILGWCWLAPLLLYKPNSPKNNEVFVTMLDVGQGLAMLIETSHHALIYDAGPKFNLGFDAGRDVVVPYLHLRRITKIDMLMISHGDSDHAGGVDAIEKNFSTNVLLTSATEKLKQFKPKLCQAGQHWQWDGIRFEVLYPLTSTSQDFATNNRSCVLQMTIGEHRLLLVGDIEKQAELQLINSYGVKLNSEILVAPHHGSKTSSTWKFVQTVNPQYVLFAIGEHNRFHFPALSILNRYRMVGAKVSLSSESGAIRFEMSADKPISWQEEGLNRKLYFPLH